MSVTARLLLVQYLSTILGRALVALQIAIKQLDRLRGGLIKYMLQPSVPLCPSGCSAFPYACSLSDPAPLVHRLAASAVGLLTLPLLTGITVVAILETMRPGIVSERWIANAVKFTITRIILLTILSGLQERTSLVAGRWPEAQTRHPVFPWVLRAGDHHCP